mgnify:CR=1 FL=1
MGNKITSLEKRLGIAEKETTEIRKVNAIKKRVEGQRVNNPAGKDAPKKSKHQAFMVYLDKDIDALFSKSIAEEKSKAEKKSDVSKTLIAEEAIVRWMQDKGYMKK